MSETCISEVVETPCDGAEAQGVDDIVLEVRERKWWSNELEVPCCLIICTSATEFVSLLYVHCDGLLGA